MGSLAYNIKYIYIQATALTRAMEGGHGLGEQKRITRAATGGGADGNTSLAHGASGGNGDAEGSAAVGVDASAGQ